ncbi:MAG: DUF2513 domain-containing protein [Clostridia bacterium]|nr:DUF2513 domain-containing protein [Clostridia bacterium]
MRLNMDCVRDILLCVEENTGLRQTCYFVDDSLNDVASFLGNKQRPQEYQTTLGKTYDNDTLIYHVNYCVEANLISRLEHAGSCVICISDLTPAGHELIGNIRKPENWEKLKNAGARAGAFGLNVVKSAAEGFGASLVMSYLHL